MESPYTYQTDEERAARRAKRARAREKRRQAQRRRMLCLLLLAALFLLLILFAVFQSHRAKPTPQTDPVPAAEPSSEPEPDPEPEPAPVYTASATAETVHLGDTLPSQYAVVIDRQKGVILAEKNMNAVISPASMTKILTLLVAAEQITNLDDTFTITTDITDFCYVNDCSVVGLKVGETVSIRELLYGTILSSGADAALGLAVYTAGSQEAFVALMNEKLDALGLSETAHFTNCVGIYAPEHHCTVYDMAMILSAAMENPLCREVLSAHTYQTDPTPEHPDGQTLSNWFLRKIEDHDQEQSVRAVGAKTGYVQQSGNCAASWGENSQGTEYLCVTANAYSGWRAIYDHVALYQTYCK